MENGMKQTFMLQSIMPLKQSKSAFFHFQKVLQDLHHQFNKS